VPKPSFHFERDLPRIEAAFRPNRERSLLRQARLAEAI
jgi:hypothetical protein